MGQRAGALATLATLVVAASASAASRVDGSVAISPLTTRPHVGRVFSLGVMVDGGEGSDTGYSFKLTLSASPRLTILKASSTFTQLNCQAVAAPSNARAEMSPPASRAPSTDCELRRPASTDSLRDS